MDVSVDTPVCRYTYTHARSSLASVDEASTHTTASQNYHTAAVRILECFDVGDPKIGGLYTQTGAEVPPTIRPPRADQK